MSGVACTARLSAVAHKVLACSNAQGSKTISPWHDIPMKVTGKEGLVHFVCEIPKETKAKMEIALDEASNPVKQDTKKGKLRDYPYNINWNYGLIPQTWEDPAHENAEAGGAGDNDPVDVVEIGSSQLEMGGVYQVKPIGCYAMIDEGELDWKVIAINSGDPLFDKINSVEDVETHIPGELQRILEWFRDYKTPDGKPQNKFGYDNKCMSTDFTWKVLSGSQHIFCLCPGQLFSFLLLLSGEGEKCVCVCVC